MRIQKISQEEPKILENPMEKTIKRNEYDISCPFCQETDFDLIGLKSHLLHGDCEEFNNIENIRRIL